VKAFCNTGIGRGLHAQARCPRAMSKPVLIRAMEAAFRQSEERWWAAR